MRHLSTAELLLYAEGELERRSLCRHVADCVDCKAKLVDLQETYVLAASELRATTPEAAPHPAQITRLRRRLAAEAELLAAHLGTEELLLSLENCLAADRQAHLDACAQCRDQAAEIHLQLAEIEWELHRKLAFELPAARRTKALAALRERLAQEVAGRTAVSARQWLPSLRLPRPRLPPMPAFAPYAAACATLAVALWLGWDGPAAPEAPAPPPASTATTAPAGAPPAPRERPGRFVWPGPAPSGPAPVELLALSTAPALEPAWTAPQLPPALALPARDAPPAPPPDRQTLAAQAERPPAASPPTEAEAPEAAVAGAWLLARTGLWKEGLRVGGTAAEIRLSGSVATEEDRIRIERKLLAAASRTLSLEIDVRRAGPRPVGPAPLASPAQVSGGAVRSALLEHYRDAARRSFQTAERSLLESELDRYVSEIFRHNADLLAHAHTLDSLVRHPGVDSLHHTASFRQVARFHLDGIARQEGAIYARLAEALPRRYWAHLGAKRGRPQPASLGTATRQLLASALALDGALAAMFFGGAEVLDARSENLSSADLLREVRLGARQVKAVLR